MKNYLLLTVIGLSVSSLSYGADENNNFKSLKDKFENMGKSSLKDGSGPDSGDRPARTRVEQLRQNFEPVVPVPIVRGDSRDASESSNVSQLRRKFDTTEGAEKPALTRRQDLSASRAHVSALRDAFEPQPSFLVDGSSSDDSSSDLDNQWEDGDDLSALPPPVAAPSTSTAPAPSASSLALESSFDDPLQTSSDHGYMLKQQSHAYIQRQGPSKVQRSMGNIDMEGLINLQDMSPFQKQVEEKRQEVARKKGVFPIVHVPIMKYFEFLKINQLHDRNLKGDHIKIGVIDSWFDYQAPNLKDVISKSTQQLAPVKGTFGFTANENKYNVGFSNENEEYKVTGHHGNHVASIIHSIAPNASIKYINFQAEQGIAGKDPEHYCQAIERAVASGVDFINFSLIFPGPSQGDPMDPSIRLALIKAAKSGVGLVVALGNDNQTEQSNAYVKDLIELSESEEIGGRMILVGATQYVDGKERRAVFSNHPEMIRAKKVIYAPGESIKAFGGGGLEVVKSGTSQASPMITGIASLLKEHLTKLEILKSKKKITKMKKHDFITFKKSIPPEVVFSILLRSARQSTYTGSVKRLGREFGRGIVNPMGAIILANKMQNADRPLRPWAQKFKDNPPRRYGVATPVDIKEAKEILAQKYGGDQSKVETVHGKKKSKPQPQDSGASSSQTTTTTQPLSSPKGEEETFKTNFVFPGIEKTSPTSDVALTKEESSDKRKQKMVRKDAKRNIFDGLE